MAVVREYQEVPVRYEDRSGGLGVFLAVLLLVAFLFLALFYGLPLLRSATRGPQINVPSQLDVNVHQQ